MKRMAPESSPDRVLLVDEIASDREELARALDAEGFRVVQAESASEAVRQIWEGSFLVVFIPSTLTGTNPMSLSEQLRQMAPEIETVIHSRNDERSRLVRKAIEIRDGVIAA
ncbi:MAG TPA: response regulator [Kofleriaceae bacterium]|nr:response regulator [Kofleriaceae bacterium]